MRRELLKEVTDRVSHVQPTEVIISTSEEKLAYSDVVRFGGQRIQPVTESRRIQRTSQSTESVRVPNMRQRPYQVTRQQINRPSRENAKKEPERQTTTKKQRKQRKPKRKMRRLNNIFSYLDVEECVSDDDEEEVTLSLPEGMIGGWSVDNTKKQTERRISLDNSADNSTKSNRRHRLWAICNFFCSRNMFWKQPFKT